jgi:opacity protein-like surface antigen
MKRLFVLLSMLCAAGGAAPRHAVAATVTPKLGFGVHGHFSLGSLPGPAIDGTSALQDAYGPGYGGGAHLDVSLVNLGFRLSGDYVTYALDEERFRDSYRDVFGGAVEQLGVDGGGLGIASFAASGKLTLVPLPVVRPYLTGGAGLAWLSVEEAKTSIAGVPGRTFPSSRQSGKTCLNLGAGVELSLGVTLFAEARYVWLLSEGETSTFVPVTLGVTF